MLDEYKELYRSAADVIPDWMRVPKNDLCRAYVANKGNDQLQNAYFSAVMYKYWNLISKYYYISVSCATPEDCYEWLVDSVACCLNLASWENPESSIYKDPNGPDKVINRCMKCARLTYYQFVNRKKRKDNFGLLSIDELKELFGTTVTEPSDPTQELDTTAFVIKDYIIEQFNKKDYFVAFLLSSIVNTDVFDITREHDSNDLYFEFNIRKLVKVMNTLDEDFLCVFAMTYGFNIKEVIKAFNYVKAIPSSIMRKKILQTFENLKHTDFVKGLIEGDSSYVT